MRHPLAGLCVAPAALAHESCPRPSSELPSSTVCHSSIDRIASPLLHTSVQYIQFLEWQVQELVLVVPPHILLLELFSLLRLWGWFRDLRNEVCGRSFGDTVDQNTEEGYFEEDEESDSEAVKYSTAIREPGLALSWCVLHPGEVRLELATVSLSST